MHVVWVREAGEIEAGLGWLGEIGGVLGGAVVVGGSVGAWGEAELVRLGRDGEAG